MRESILYTFLYTQYEVWDLCFELQSTHTYIYVCMYVHVFEREREGE